MSGWKDHIAFVLVEPTEPGNIGAAARALKNMGFRRLELVRPTEHLSFQARAMACGAKDILERAPIHSSFEEAIAGATLVVGTTRRRGRNRGLFLPFKDGAERIVRAAPGNKVAVLFGNEHNGLTNSELASCAFLLTIPTDDAAPSLNLAQSVLLAAYELSRLPAPGEIPKFVTQTEIQRLFRRVQSTIRLLEYTARGDRDLEAEILRNLRQVIGRSGLTTWEYNMIYGLCSQAERKLKPRPADSGGPKGRRPGY
ncbi:MAG: RNA methyltransferase [Candidatus Aminicenantes bacterium]|nr:RNA methyltransferase [Candidatus Aminicenantes bacterium]